MPFNAGSTPPPTIAKMGPYTVFITPHSPPPPAEKSAPPPVLPPPHQFHKPAHDSFSVGGYLKNAADKLQSAHSSLDSHMARWLGLDQSKYQWVLEDYYESKKFEKVDAKELTNIKQVK